MNNLYDQVASQLTQLKLMNLDVACTELRSAVATLRLDTQRRMAVLNAMDPAASDFAETISSINELLLTIEILVKATVDMEKLQTAATKAMERVWKRLQKQPTLGG